MPRSKRSMPCWTSPADTPMRPPRKAAPIWPRSSGHVPAESAANVPRSAAIAALVHAVVWLSGHYHVGLGRFDQYMWPYLEADLRAGRLDDGLRPKNFWPNSSSRSIAIPISIPACSRATTANR